MLFPLMLTKNVHPLKPGDVGIPANLRTVASQFCLKLLKQQWVYAPHADKMD